MKKTIIVAGAAGEGINTVAMFIEKILKHSGYSIYSYKNYMSRVRGGYNYSTIVVSSDPVYAIEEQGDIFIALNKEAHEHAPVQLKENGFLISEMNHDNVKTVLFSKEEMPQEVKGKTVAKTQ